MLIGKYIRLRAIEEDDLPLLAAWKSDPEINRFFHEYGPISLRQQRLWYENQLSSSREHTFVVCDLEGRPLGTAGLVNIDTRSMKAELARVIIGDKTRRGAGIGAQIFALIAQYAFEHLNLNRLYGEVLLSNPSALSYYKKVGCKEEGIARQHVFKNGRYEDVVLLAILREDYYASKADGVIGKIFEKYISDPP
jgi:RimJ/RimL family protein N-acetyltransferase